MTFHENALRRYKDLQENSENSLYKYRFALPESKDQLITDLLASSLQLTKQEIHYILDLAKLHHPLAPIDKPTYQEVMQAVCAYKAIDISNNSTINSTNYYLVLWLYD